MKAGSIPEITALIPNPDIRGSSTKTIAGIFNHPGNNTLFVALCSRYVSFHLKMTVAGGMAMMMRQKLAEVTGYTTLLETLAR